MGTALTATINAMPQMIVEGDKNHWVTITGIPVYAFAHELINKFGRKFFDAHKTTMSVKQVSGKLRYVRFWTKSLLDQEVTVYHLEFKLITEPLLKIKSYIVVYTTCTEESPMVSISKRELAELQARACINNAYYSPDRDPRKKARLA